MAQSAAVWQEEDRYLAGVTERACRQVLQTLQQGVRANSAQLNQLPLAIKRRVLRRAFAVVAGDDRNLSFEHTESLLALNSAPVGNVLHLPREVQAQRKYNEIILTLGRSTGESIKAFYRPLAVPGVTTIPELGLDVHVAVDTKLAEISSDSLVATGSTFLCP